MTDTGKARLRVLVLVTSTDRRGAETEGCQLAAELAASGLSATCVALAPGKVGGLAMDVLGRGAMRPSTLWRLRRAARRVDVVLAYGSSTLPACALGLLGARTPFVYRSIGDPTQWVRGRWHRRRTGWLLRQAKAVVALWSAAATAITELYGVSPEKVRCIPNARPVPAGDEPSRSDARVALGLPQEAKVIAWAGAFSDEKHPLLAVSVAAEVEGAWLLMAGDGPRRDAVLEAGHAQIGDRFVAPGALPSLESIWAAADVCLLTSRTEGMPGVLIEARLRGVPVVASDVGAVREVVGEHGVLVPADAPVSQWAEAIRQATRSEIGGDSVAASAFTWSQVAAQWRQMLESQLRRSAIAGEDPAK